ncbi:hypothetical protein GobsT_30650 [Gemmata obscuriglobus]|uniref:DUF2892 domain-containing protein n=1 Tax=Gemmata obscuriglobus TaxID=114 RepID=A0A2Z3H348_9BACT|nr:hypothetical protein [Gemmata obscuriglobus]AWM38742.1 hypothetical protein C1280_18260 [Gemmata obscuriglobus]QEG28289.1 hypothetical protein GobsT_30650 [Gemmata obscuriglobus]VTS06113.1 Uncharacterized protein OS=Planctomyces maris DSM 8797 GN=PM8797T_04105 PE=4 SV=1 [Gemmata obscuriglobus UQM 2246]
MNILNGTRKLCANQVNLEQRLACLADAGPQAITDRIAQLDREWSAGRATKALIGLMIVTGFALTALLNPWWLILPAVGGVFLLQYLFGRSSWLGATFREMGFRSGQDIDQERFALRALRGDFKNLPTVHEIESKDDISRLEGEGGIALDPEESKTDARDAVKVVMQAAKS